MPVYNFHFPPEKPQLALRLHGPKVQGLFSLHPVDEQALDKSNEPVPDRVPGLALLDTGASVTVVDHKIAERLHLSPRGTRRLSVPNATTEQPTFSLAFTIVAPAPFTLTTLRAPSSDLAGLGVDLLIGRDILSQCLLIMNGPDGSFTLST